MQQEGIEKLTKKRWLILFASCLINLCVGSMYAWSSLSAPMAAPSVIRLSFFRINGVWWESWPLSLISYISGWPSAA